ncbi:hypothetical protein DFH06DRAFT_1310041 [Mycena polygramma]|nr:hypothetical protein DFH06DRAFT_1310041 [Mycena polygramma]
MAVSGRSDNTHQQLPSSFPPCRPPASTVLWLADALTPSLLSKLRSSKCHLSLVPLAAALAVCATGSCKETYPTRYTRNQPLTAEASVRMRACDSGAATTSVLMRFVCQVSAILFVGNKIFECRAVAFILDFVRQVASRLRAAPRRFCCRGDHIECAMSRRRARSVSPGHYLSRLRAAAPVWLPRRDALDYMVRIRSAMRLPYSNNPFFSYPD